MYIYMYMYKYIYILCTYKYIYRDHYKCKPEHTDQQECDGRTMQNTLYICMLYIYIYILYIHIYICLY